MSITATCGACGRKFVAPSQFQGKRVKCKGCGEIFMVPSASAAGRGLSDYDPETDPLAALAAVATSDSSSMGSDHTLLERSFHDEETDAPANEAPESLGFSPRSAVASGITPNVLTFNYPGSSDIDQWLPVVTIVLGFLLLAASVVSPDAKGIGWISFVRFITPSILYVGLTFPITLGMLTKAARKLRYALPPNARLRCFACYMPAFVFLTWMQMGGEGLTVAQLFVGIIGLGISSGMVWLLFRLREEHIGTTIAYGAGGFAASIALSIALTIGLNNIGMLMVANDHAQASVPTSPFGEGLSWVATPPAAAVVKPAPEPAVAVTTAPAIDEPVAATESNAIGTIDPATIPGTIDDVIDPLGTNAVIGVIRNKSNGIAIEAWNTQIWQRQRGTLQLPARPDGNIVISTDGDRIAWIAEFPRLSVQVWSFDHASVVARIDLDRNGGHAELVGFISPDQLLIDRVASAAPAELPVTPETPKPAVDDAPPAAVNTTPGENKLSDALSGASDSQRAKAAAGTPTTPVAPPAAVPTANVETPATGGENSHEMSILDVTTGSTVHTFTLPQVTTDLAGGWGKAMSETLHMGQNIALSIVSRRLVVATRIDDTPALAQFDLVTGKPMPVITVKELDPGLSGLPTGLAYSNDGMNLAALFENNGSALLLAYDSSTGKRTANYLYPAGPLEGQTHGDFKGGSMIWLDPSAFWLVYGQGIIGVQSGMHIKSADLDLREPMEQRMLDEDRIQIVTNANGIKRVNVLKLDRTRLDAAGNSPN